MTFYFLTFKTPPFLVINSLLEHRKSMNTAGSFHDTYYITVNQNLIKKACKRKILIYLIYYSIFFKNNHIQFSRNFERLSYFSGIESGLVFLRLRMGQYKEISYKFHLICIDVSKTISKIKKNQNRTKT